MLVSLAITSSNGLLHMVIQKQSIRSAISCLSRSDSAQSNFNHDAIKTVKKIYSLLHHHLVNFVIPTFTHCDYDFRRTSKLDA